MPDTQISEEMVERAARALFPSDFNDRHGDNCLDCKEARDEARTKARTALEAALFGHVVVPREPTQAMIDAGRLDYTLGDPEIECSESGLADAYRAMIQAAPQMEG